METGKKYGYIRVSTTDQAENYSLSNQREALLRNEIELENIFEDIGSASNTDRSNFQKLLEITEPGDSIHVVRLDRFSRSLLDLLKTVTFLQEKKVQLVAYDQPFSGDPQMRLLGFAFYGYFAEFEQRVRKQRQIEGIARAKLDKKYLGRKTVLTPEV